MTYEALARSIFVTFARQHLAINSHVFAVCFIKHVGLNRLLSANKCNIQKEIYLY